MDSPRWLLPVALLALALLYPLGRLVTGSAPGEPCRSNRDCRAFWDAHCVQTGTGREKSTYCAPSCSASRSCPEAWTCGSAIEMGDRAFGDELAVCVPPGMALPEPPGDASAADAIAERVRALLDAGSDVERGERRSQVSALALRLAERAREMHAADLAKACYAIDVARFDCGEVQRGLGEAKEAVARLEERQRAKLEDAMRVLDGAVGKLCGGVE